MLSAPHQNIVSASSVPGEELPEHILNVPWRTTEVVKVGRQTDLDVYLGFAF